MTLNTFLTAFVFIFFALSLLPILFSYRQKPEREPRLNRGDPYAHPATDYKGRLIRQVRQ